VMATEKVIVPNAVGVDIGCGVCAQKTTLTNIEINQIKNIMADIRSKIPMGFNKHKAKQDENLMPEFGDWKNSRIGKEWNNACRSLGTLGGGNHFIEIQKGSDGHIWIMLHSGSRNLGKKVADYYNRSAINSSRRQG